MPAAHPDGLLLLDKPEGFSSTQALARAKRFLAARKAGHTGTLDPFATGLLPIAVGEATKFSRFLIDAPKEYLATLRLGWVSTTGDPEGEVTASGDAVSDSARIDLHSGHAIAPRTCRTNSPQTRHSRLAPRISAASSWSSVLLSDSTVILLPPTRGS